MPKNSFGTNLRSTSKKGFDDFLFYLLSQVASCWLPLARVDMRNSRSIDFSIRPKEGARD